MTKRDRLNRTCPVCKGHGESVYGVECETCEGTGVVLTNDAFRDPDDRRRSRDKEDES